MLFFIVTRCVESSRRSKIPSSYSQHSHGSQRLMPQDATSGGTVGFQTSCLWLNFERSPAAGAQYSAPQRPQ